MAEIFITNVREPIQAKTMLGVLENSFPELTLNFDLESSAYPFPCGHTILRAEGVQINTENILSKVHKAGFMSEVLEDKICK